MKMEFTIMAVGVVVAVLLGLIFLPFVPSTLSLAYWLLIGIGMIPAHFLWFTPPIFYELENGDFNFTGILRADVLATEIVFAVEGVIITFLYGDLVWGVISLAIFAASAFLFYKYWKKSYNFNLYSMLILIPSCALGVIFGILSGGGLACVILTLFLAIFCTLLLMKWYLFGFLVKQKGPYDNWTAEDYARSRASQ